MLHPEYDGIKFYSETDWSVVDNLEKSVVIFESFDASKEYTDVNEVIELYNIQELMDSGSRLKEWDEKSVDCYQNICRSFSKILGEFFGKVDDANFMSICHDVCIEYIEDFWKLISEYKTFRRISKETFMAYLNEPETTLHIILQQKELVKHYGEELAAALRVSEQTPRLIADKFLIKCDGVCPYYFPKELHSSEYEGILQNYVNSENANLNILQILASAQNSGECPISDKLKLSAKKVCKAYWDNPLSMATRIGYEYGLRVAFEDVEEVKSVEIIDNTYQFTYDIKWLLENLDYPTILNNFIYIFEQFDYCWRSSLVSVKSKLGIFERTLFVRAIRGYTKGSSFDFFDKLSTVQTKGYYDILKDNGIRLEDVFQWFFEEYLLQEFNAEGFYFNPPSMGTTLVEKWRTIASEMDRVLKQFRMYVQDGEIDRELFEMSSEHIVFSQVPSFINNKYAYGNSDDVRSEQFLLFSNQSRLSYTNRFQEKYNCFYELLLNENVALADYHKYQCQIIRRLLGCGIVLEGDDGYLRLDLPRVSILKDLYDHDVICIQYYNRYKTIIDEWCDNGRLRVVNSLFSEPEQDYLNYVLNKSAFSDGLDLRNKYIHGTNPLDAETQLIDYMRLLKIIVLVIGKINEEFCLRAQEDR